MKPSTNRSVWFLGTILAFAAQITLAEAKTNPYQAIPERNPFGLKPPPDPAPVGPVTPVTPPAQVVLTGITTMFGTVPRALLEVTEQEPGKAKEVKRPILREGEREGSIEVISIDIDKSLVRIRTGGMETNVTFPTPKLAGAPAGPSPTTPPPLGATPTPGVYNPANPAGTPGHPSGGVTLYGGGAAATPAASPNPAASAAGAAANFSGGLRSIPSRSLRTDAAAPQDIDPAKQYLNMAIQSEIHNSAGRNYPPLPPVPGTHEPGGVPPPLPPIPTR